MLPSHTSTIFIIILHICAFAIIITSYLLSKYTNSLAKTRTRRPVYLNQHTLSPPLRKLTPAATVVQRQRSAFVCHLWAAKHSHQAGPAAVMLAYATSALLHVSWLRCLLGLQTSNNNKKFNVCFFVICLKTRSNLQTFKVYINQVYFFNGLKSRKKCIHVYILHK
jgi:hypothetical protein